MRTQTTYNKIVNFDTDGKEVQMLGDVFQYKSGFKGATGTRFDMISKAEYKERMRKSNVMDALRECSNNKSYTQLQQIYKDMKENDEIESFIFDLSYQELHDNMRKELKLSKTDCYIFSCSCGGRMFDKDFQGNFNTDLSQIIRDAETK
jgi:hypothetical protein